MSNSKEEFFILSSTRFTYILAKLSGLAPYDLPYGNPYNRLSLSLSNLTQFAGFMCIFVFCWMKFGTTPWSSESDIVNAGIEYISYYWIVVAVGYVTFNMLSYKARWRFYLEIIEKEAKV